MYLVTRTGASLAVPLLLLFYVDVCWLLQSAVVLAIVCFSSRPLSVPREGRYSCSWVTIYILVKIYI